MLTAIPCVNARMVWNHPYFPALSLTVHTHTQVGAARPGPAQSSPGSVLLPFVTADLQAPGVPWGSGCAACAGLWGAAAGDTPPVTRLEVRLAGRCFHPLGVGVPRGRHLPAVRHALWAAAALAPSCLHGVLRQRAQGHSCGIVHVLFDLFFGCLSPYQRTHVPAQASVPNWNQSFKNTFADPLFNHFFGILSVYI